MKVLSIGNSFSCDATRYLHGIAHADGVEVESVNLYIPGCPLEKHYQNMLGDYSAYVLFFNGQDTGFKTSIKEALLSRHWDVVTVQQASKLSFKKETYYPYISALVAYIRECAPQAKIVMHETWAYQEGSERLFDVADFTSSDQMLDALRQAYTEVTSEMKLDGLIPSGDMLGELVRRGIPTVHRPDASHASKGIGRYALGLLWYRMLTGNSVSQNTFCDFDVPIEDEHIAIAKKYVDSLSPLFN